MKEFNELSLEEVLDMSDEDFLKQWAAWEERDTLSLQENLNQKEEWL